MSSESDQARAMAERIARRISPADPVGARPAPRVSSELGSEIAAMRAGLGELQRRLAQLESRVRSEDFADSATPAPNPAAHHDKAFVPPTHSPWLAGVNAAISHVSQERFGVEEAAVSELVDFFQSEKSCSLEPGGKPCDHCSMCSSRGF